MCNGLCSFSTFSLFQPHPAKSRCGGARTGCGTAPAPARVQLCKSVVQLTQQATAVHMLHLLPAKLQTSTKVNTYPCRGKQNRSTLNCESIPISTSIMGKTFFWDNLKAIDEKDCYHMPLYNQAHHHKPPSENLYKARHSTLTRLGHEDYHHMPTHCNTPPQNPV